MKIKTVNLAKTGCFIPKLICENMALYDFMIKAYQKVILERSIYHVMQGRRVSVIIKALSSGAVFSQDSNITDASYSDTLDNIINRVEVTLKKEKS